MANVSVRRGKKKDGLSRERKTLVLRVDLIKRLETAAIYEGVDESDIIEMLIEERLSGYTVSVRGKRLGLRKDRQTPAADVDSPAEEAA